MLLRVVLNVMLLPATTASTAEPEKAPLTLDVKKKSKQRRGKRREIGAIGRILLSAPICFLLLPRCRSLF